MLRLIKKLSDGGDTIVEVIIVLAVLGLAVSISYATASRSLLDTRQAQEASQAAELIHAQLEALRTMANNPPTINGTANPDYIFPATTPPQYCVSVDNADIAHVALLTDPICTPPAGGSLYNLTIDFTSISATPGKSGGHFKIQATWDDVEGQGKDTATLEYDLFQTPQPS